jgi:hypothetical protein
LSRAFQPPKQKHTLEVERSLEQQPTAKRRLFAILVRMFLIVAVTEVKNNFRFAKKSDRYVGRNAVIPRLM